MIQRIQSVFMLLVVLVSAVLPLVLPLWINKAGIEFFAKQDVLIAVAFYSIAALALVAILLFKQRKNQFVVNRLNMIFNLFLLGFFVYRSLNLSG